MASKEPGGHADPNDVCQPVSRWTMRREASNSGKSELWGVSPIDFGCVIAQAFFSRGVSAISLKSRGFFFQRNLA